MKIPLGPPFTKGDNYPRNKIKQIDPSQKFLLVARQKECFPDLVLLKQRFIGLSKRTFHSLVNTSPVLSIIPWEDSWVGPYISSPLNR